jgi:hypothetical protein
MHRRLIRGTGVAAVAAGVVLTGAVAFAAPVNTDAGHATATMARASGGLGGLASQAAQAGMVSALTHAELGLTP